MACLRAQKVTVATEKTGNTAQEVVVAAVDEGPDEEVVAAEVVRNERRASWEGEGAQHL